MSKTSVACCKSYTNMCDNKSCVHFKQHKKHVDHRTHSDVCTKWTMCMYVGEKVRCIIQQ